MDRRQKKTRSAVFEAFTRLLEKKSYNRISVQEIIDEADIGRSTFYSHFETKDALLKALCTEVFDHVFSDHLTRENTHDFSGRTQGVKEEITHLLYHIQDSRSYIKGLLSGESGEIFMQYFREYLCKMFEGIAREMRSDIPQSYILNHLVCDFAETVRWWMSHEEYSPEDISRFFLRTTLSE